MKKFTLTLAAVFVLAIACGDSDTPDQVVIKFVDAWNTGDGDGIVACMSSDGLSELDGYIAIFRADPETSVEQLAMIGVEFTPEEVENLTVGQFLTAMLSNEEAASSMPDLSDVVIGETTISEDGQSATVAVTTNGEEEELGLILEDGSWKISETP
jgi:hypothetical protein